MILLSLWGLIEILLILFLPALATVLAQRIKAIPLRIAASAVFASLTALTASLLVLSALVVTFYPYKEAAPR